MKAHRKYINVNAAITDGIYQPMFFCDTAAPFALFPFQRLRLPYTCKGVFQDVMSASKALMRFRMRTSPLRFQYSKSSAAWGRKAISISRPAILP